MCCQDRAWRSEEQPGSIPSAMDTGLAALAGTGGGRSHGTCTRRATERGSSWGHADEASQELQGSRQRRPKENIGYSRHTEDHGLPLL